MFVGQQATENSINQYQSIVLPREHGGQCESYTAPLFLPIQEPGTGTHDDNPDNVQFA